jgi:RNA polymerase sigma factor (sigma-70 family)
MGCPLSRLTPSGTQRTPIFPKVAPEPFMPVIVEEVSSRGTRFEWHARFHEVVPPYLGEAHALARSLTGGGADSEDIIQEACLRAFRGISSFGGTNARAWVLTIVRHTAYDWIRKKRATPELVEDLTALTDRIRYDELTPELELGSHQDAQQLELAIQSLPEAFRRVLVMRHVEGLAYKEIAGTTGVPIGTVMSRLSRARRMVWEALGRGRCGAAR